jgi:hypothetical protein
MVFLPIAERSPLQASPFVLLSSPTTFPVPDACICSSASNVHAGLLAERASSNGKIHIEGDFLHGFIQSLAINAGSILL